MDKPKFKMTVDEMLGFNDDCCLAAQQCPQWNKNWLEDRDICTGKVKPKDLVKHWKAERVLWELGYSEGLSLDALEVFKEYKAFKEKLKAWKDLNKEGE
jgi:hypothetical protein